MIESLQQIFHPKLTSYTQPPEDPIREMVDYKIFFNKYGPEKWVEGFEGIQFINKIYFTSIVGGLLYLLFLRTAPKVMEKRQPFQLKFPLAVWNLFLSIFSGIGFLRCAPIMYFLFSKSNFDWIFCHPPTGTYLHGPISFWAFAFAVSKYFELIDTLFLVLRKKPVGFLHWFHHLTVLWYTVDTTSRETAIGISFVLMNYFVHALMYFYYFLSAVGKPPKWALPVTILQISQMFGGCYFIFTMTKSYFKYGPWKTVYPLENDYHLAPLDKDGSEKYFTLHGCSTCLFSMIAGILIYGSYLYLFCEFAFSRYLLKKTQNKKDKIESASIKSDAVNNKLKKRENINTHQ